MCVTLLQKKKIKSFLFLFFLPLNLLSIQTGSPEMQHIQMLQHSGQKVTGVTQNNKRKARR